MGLPGVTLQVQNGNLGLQAPSSEKTLIYIGCSLGGVPNTLNFYGDSTSMISALLGGEVVEAAAHELSVAGGVVGVLNVNPSVAGGFSAVTHTGTGSNTITVSAAPAQTTLVTVAATGALGTGTATFKLGNAPASQPVTLTGSYVVPGTYTPLTFPAHTYTAGETYTFTTLGTSSYAANGSGGSSASVTEVSSPIDDYSPVITIVLGGALGTAQFTYSLDGTPANATAAIVTPSGGVYAIPGTGIVLTFGGSMVAGDVYSFQACPPSFSNTDLTNALNALTSTYLSASYSMGCVVGNLVSAAAWATQTATLETAALALFNKGVYARFFNGAPTLGTVTGNGVVDVADTDAALTTARLAVSAPHVGACAGDLVLTSSLSGLSQRRNLCWGASARAAANEASQNIGYVGLGGLEGVTAIYRDELATPALDAIGFITARTYPGNISSGTGVAGFYITDGHTMDAVTSDYYPLANARVIDRACGIAFGSALPLVNSKVPTTTRNGIAGVITEKKAQQIESRVTSALTAGLVFNEPQDAVNAAATCSRTHNILSDGNLIITVAVQPYAYARTITIPIGMAVSV